MNTNLFFAVGFAAVFALGCDSLPVKEKAAEKTTESKERNNGYHVQRTEKFKKDFPLLGKMKEAKKVEITKVGLPKAPMGEADLTALIYRNNLSNSLGDPEPIVFTYKNGDRVSVVARLTFDEGVQACAYVAKVNDVINKGKKIPQFLLESEMCI
jgi:hypothetical protein